MEEPVSQAVRGGAAPPGGGKNNLAQRFSAGTHKHRHLYPMHFLTPKEFNWLDDGIHVAEGPSNPALKRWAKLFLPLRGVAGNISPNYTMPIRFGKALAAKAAVFAALPARLKSCPFKQSIGGHGGGLRDAGLAHFRMNREGLQPFTDFRERGSGG